MAPRNPADPASITGGGRVAVGPGAGRGLRGPDPCERHDLHTLADAISAANTDTAVGGCAVGSDHDILNIGSNITLQRALPEIVGAVTIEGHGHRIERHPRAGRFRILTAHAGLTLNNAVILGGSSTGNGGGIFIRDGTPASSISDTTIRNNATDGDGGGVHVGGYYGELRVRNSSVTGNAAAEYGSGIHAPDTIVTFENGTVSGNSAERTAGIDCLVATIRNSTVSGNAGDGIVAYEELNLVNSTVSGNRSMGCVAAAVFGSVHVVNATVTGNDDGGMLFGFK